ncbi:MAG: conjugal transfer protein TraW [Gammaproteobacteria bacterium]|nr:conjugal transfer protein TraW [Gammaproteobacteria bacterium]
MDVLTRYFKLLIPVFIITFSSVGAGTSGLTDEDKALRDLAKSIREQSSEITIPVNIHQREAKAQAEQLFNSLKEQQPDIFDTRDKRKRIGRILFFASQSMSLEAMEDMFTASTDHLDSAVVFRGVRDPENLSKSIMEIQRVAARQTPVANVMLDPTLYRDYGVDKVPTIIYLDEDKETEIARVSGLTQPDWLLRQVKSGDGKDYGVKGSVHDILERDLIEVMKERVAAIDWEDKKEQAINRYWDKQRYLELPGATKERTREVDPSILISEDITDANGNVLVAQGTIINPLELRPFTQALIVFDPLDPVQMSLVDQKLPELTSKYPRITLIVTRFNKEKGWESYKSITEHFDSPVFNLTSEVKSRFQLEYTPAIITAAKRHFIIEELTKSEDPAAIVKE